MRPSDETRGDPGASSDELPLDAEWTREREERFVARVLARTTRQTPPRRRALLPLDRFRGSRRTGAPWLRMAAAGLLLTLPVVAYRSLRETWGEERVPRFAAAVAPPVSTGDRTEIGAGLADQASRERTREGIERALTSARLLLETSGQARRARSASPEALAPPAPRPPLELQLLEARAKGLRERRWDVWLKEIPLAQVGTLALALWCEVQLDRYVLTGELPPAWRKAESLLQSRAEGPVVATGSGRLLTRALQRAHAYGLAGTGQTDGQAAQEELWSQSWFDDLEGAGLEVGLGAEPLWRAWVEWRPQ